MVSLLIVNGYGIKPSGIEQLHTAAKILIVAPYDKYSTGNNNSINQIHNNTIIIDPK